MSGFQLSWNIEGEQQLSRKLLILAEKLDDWTPAFKETAYTLKSLFSNDVFSSEGGAINEKWSPLSKAYAYKKAQKYPGKGLLVATGKMQNSFMTLYKSDMAAVWNEATYFKYHQSNKPRSKLPRRVMMKLAEAQKVQIVRIFNTYFQKAIKQTN